MELKEIKPEYAKPELEKPTTLDQIFGRFRTVASVPTAVPNNINNQIQIYKNGATIRLYIYDTTNNAWRYATLT